jgi:adenosylmethionine-8-amino-7-oxononanoate aminotransferase
MPLSQQQIEILGRTFLDYQATSEFLERPMVVERAEGLYYWDIDGKRYFDAIGGVFVAILGHQHPRLTAAVCRQMQKVTFAPPLHSISDVALKFIEKLGSVTPGNLRFVKPFCGGSEAVESALKFTRQYYQQTGHPKKFKVISRYQSYHGATFGGMAASGNGIRKSSFEPHLHGFIKVFPPTFYRDQFSSWEEANRFAARSLEAVIEHEDPESVAAFLVEPIGNTGGIITPTEEYFRILREICNHYNVTLIFDEVITGFAKTGEMFAADTFGVTPDIICTGKGISAGMTPLGAMIAREDMAQAFCGAPEDGRFFAHGHTFAGNPLSCAIGLAVLEEIIGGDLCAKARTMGEFLRKRLACLEKLGVVREIRGKGVLLGVELVKDTRTMEPFPELGQALKITSWRNGIVLRVDPTWFAICPPLIAKESELDEMCGLIEKSVHDALNMVN